MSDSKNFGVITAAATERRSVSPGRSYRTWSREEKDRIVGETFAPGANVFGDRALSRARSIAFVCLATQGAGFNSSGRFYAKSTGMLGMTAWPRATSTRAP
jgi:hypothetical protein